MTIKKGGASVLGYYHDINQDYFKQATLEGGHAIALADGLGSLELSQHGAKAFCEAAMEEAQACHCVIEDTTEFLRSLHTSWLRKLEGMPINKCYCTGLLVIVNQNTYYAFHIGDGILAVAADNKVYVSLEYKPSFKNYTYPLTENFEPEYWTIQISSFKHFQGAFLSSDGFEINEENFEWKDFIMDFINSYRPMTQEDISTDINNWLHEWNGPDDKTITFMIAE